MSEVYTLLIKLEGPMQSWGYRSRFDYRDTALEPTRSGVIGLICAAMGIARGEDVSRFDAIRMGVRVDREGRPERDFHTALDVIKADGSGTDTVVSRRDYLADASFTVGLQCEDRKLLDKIVRALQNPKWPLFLGRKSFPLTAPIDRDKGEVLPLLSDIVAGSLEQHLLEGDKRVLLEDVNGERTQYDWPLCFGERRFKPRRLTVKFTEKEEDVPFPTEA
ncbi:MAG: type I-E CRISPR-associated protein Cas5/CasD [Fimbriimonadaceae bacterium]|nr:type I-E CRISPR-associated protein Cas5/CasD [Fimbriimonadaceae bacterium]NUM38013.1 type I-E CRISPR-associated protein Cas5/CasD [Armatimonadota bacterium]